MRRLASFAFLLATIPALAADKGSTPHIPANAKVFIEPMNGFGSDMTAAILKKHVPVAIVSDRDAADYVISGQSQATEPGWAKTIWVGSQPAIHANIVVTKKLDNQIVYAYTWDKIKAYKGAQSAAEGIAKHMKENIKGK